MPSDLGRNLEDHELVRPGREPAFTAELADLSGDGRAAALDLRLALDEDLLGRRLGEDLVLATEVGMALEIPGKISVAALHRRYLGDAHRDDIYLAPDDSESPDDRQPGSWFSATSGRR